MAEFQIQVKGLKELQKRMRQSPELVVKEMSTSIHSSILTIQRNAMRESPVGKLHGGNLRQSIRASMESKLRGVVEAIAPYAVYVHEGTRPHLIRPKNKKVLADRYSGRFFGRLVHHPGTKANPFMIRGAESSAHAIEQFFTKGIERVVRALAS